MEMDVRFSVFNELAVALSFIVLRKFDSSRILNSRLKYTYGAYIPI